MSKRIMSMVLLLAMVFSVSVVASARTEGYGRATPTLTFSNYTAYCTGQVVAYSSSATVTASMTLYRVNSNGTLSRVASWPSRTGTGRVDFSGSAKVASGNKYQLTLSGTVTDNTGKHPINASKTATCP